MMREKINGKKRYKLYTITLLIVLVGVFCLGGCGEKQTEPETRKFYQSMNDKKKGTTEAKEEIQDRESELFMLVAINATEQSIKVYRYANRMEYQFYYSMGTDFQDKYGDHLSVASLRPGVAIHLSNTNKYGKLTKVQVADEVWSYKDITRFDTDVEKGILRIGDKNYQISKESYIFSGDKQIDLDEITEKDTLEVVGQDYHILSISVVTGHGYLQLKNTQLFEGSFLQLDTSVFTEIEPDMELEIEEGTYTLAVAHNGWGGSREISIERGETTLIDLDKLKGEGPKKGKIKFTVDVDDAEIYIDNKKVDHSLPIELQFGAHYIAVVAEGYDTWARNLYVNSEEATILISLKDEDNTVTTEDMVAQQPEDSPAAPDRNNNASDTNNSTGVTTDNAATDSSNNNSNNNSGSSSISDQDLKDYLSTITTLLNAISS